MKVSGKLVKRMLTILQSQKEMKEEFELLRMAFVLTAKEQKKKVFLFKEGKVSVEKGKRQYLNEDLLLENGVTPKVIEASKKTVTFPEVRVTPA